MARSSAVTVENNFSKGLITEATAMNYPENAVSDADNVVFAKNGKVIRRYGIDYETNYEISTASSIGVMASAVTPSDYYDDIVISEYNWTTVSGTGSMYFLVLQLGDVLTFFEVGEDNNISGDRKSFTVDLDTFQVDNPVGDVGQYLAAVECSFSSGFGKLFVTHPLCEPFFVEYDPDTDSITSTAITIQIRDFERLDDSLENDERPAVLSDTHEYNLYNQGWYETAEDTASTEQQVLTEWDSVRTDFPSNSDYWWLFKNSSNQFDPNMHDNFAIGNTPAPNGHYIWSAFQSDRSNIIGIGTVDEFTSNGARPSVTSFFSGRVWYAGTTSPDYYSRLYFSKIVESAFDFGICYQANDPTSEFNADLLPSDGGVINIPDIDRVVALVPARSSLYVFATNGVWKISGPNGVFSAEDYSITKISSTSIVSRNSIVVADGIPFWWDKAGIYAIQFDPTTGQETVANLSEQTIQTLINTIPNKNLPYVKGTYNAINKTIHWLYKSVTATTITDFFVFDKLLVCNLISQSFTPITISEGTPKVCGLVFSNLSNNDALITEEGASLVKFITYGQIGPAGVYGVTASQFNDTSYYDWKSHDGVGVAFDSFFITGYRIRGDLLRKYQSNWITVILTMQENSSCFLQGVWDYSNDPLVGRFTSSQQLYRHNAYRDYSRVKKRIRGSGYSLQLKFYSEDGKPFSIIGWATLDTGNNVP